MLSPTQAGLQQAIKVAMEDATDVVRRRIDELGTREPTIVRQGDNRILVQVPGLQNPQALKDLLGKTAKLEFKLVDTNANPADTARGVAPIGSQILPSVTPGLPPTVVKRSVIISGDQLADARQAFDQQTNAPNIQITFNATGGNRFARVTQANVGKPFAIIIDNKVVSAPRIETAISRRFGGDQWKLYHRQRQSAGDRTAVGQAGDQPQGDRGIDRRSRPRCRFRSARASWPAPSPSRWSSPSCS